MPITAGSISVARRINTGDYNHKEAKVEVHFTVEGDDVSGAVAYAAEQLAITRLASVLVTVVKPNGEVVAPESVKSEQVEQADAVTKRHRRTKAEMEAARNPKAVVESLEDPSRTEPYTYTYPTPATGSSASSSEPVAETSPTSSETAEITDKELNNACNETMNRIKNKVAIQGAIQRYTDGVVSTIPQAERAKFLVELKAL